MFSQTLALQIRNHSLVCFPVMVCLCWMHTRGTALPDGLRHDSAMSSHCRSRPTMTFLVVWHLARFTSLSHSHNLWANFNPSLSFLFIFFVAFGCPSLLQIWKRHALFRKCPFHFMMETQLFGALSVLVFLTRACASAPVKVTEFAPYDQLVSSPPLLARSHSQCSPTGLKQRLSVSMVRLG